MNFSKNQNHEDDIPFQKIQGPGQNESNPTSKKEGFSNQTKDKVEAAKSYIESILFFLIFSITVIILNRQIFKIEKGRD